MNKVIFYVFFISSMITYAQHKDYSDIQFKSKLSHYIKKTPKPKDWGINKESLSELVDILAYDQFTDAHKKDITNKLWLAFSNPKKFDYIYKDYAFNTIKDWGVKQKHKNTNYEPNPYLASWSVLKYDHVYFQWVITQIFTYEKLLAYSEKMAKSTEKSIHDLKLIRDMKFYKAGPYEYAYDYLNRNNKILKEKGLVIIINHGHFDYVVCQIKNKDKAIALFSKFKWEMVMP